MTSITTIIINGTASSSHHHHHQHQQRQPAATASAVPAPFTNRVKQHLLFFFFFFSKKTGKPHCRAETDEERVCMAHGTQQAIGSVIGKPTSKVGDTSQCSARRICHVMRSTDFSGMTHGDDFVVTGPTDRHAEVKKIAGVYPIKTKRSHWLRVYREHQGIEQKITLGK